MCVNKIRELVQWKHTWSIKHNMKQLPLKCHSKPEPNGTICLVRSREATPLRSWSEEFQTFSCAASTVLIHVYVGSKYFTSNSLPPLLGYVTSLLPSNSQTISSFKTNVLTMCVPLGSAHCCCCHRKVSLHPIVSAHVTPFKTTLVLFNTSSTKHFCILFLWVFLLLLWLQLIRIFFLSPKNLWILLETNRL